MGEWTSVEGTHNSKRVSMKKLTELVLGDYELVFKNKIMVKIFSFIFRVLDFALLKN